MLSCCGHAGRPIEGHLVLITGDNSKITAVAEELLKHTGPLTRHHSLSHSYLPGTDTPARVIYPETNARTKAWVEAGLRAAQAGGTVLLHGDYQELFPHAANILREKGAHPVHVTTALLTASIAPIQGAAQVEKHGWLSLLLPGRSQDNQHPHFDVVLNYARSSPAKLAEQLYHHLYQTQTTFRTSKLELLGTNLKGDEHPPKKEDHEKKPKGKKADKKTHNAPKINPKASKKASKKEKQSKAQDTKGKKAKASTKPNKKIRTHKPSETHEEEANEVKKPQVDKKKAKRKKQKKAASSSSSSSSSSNSCSSSSASTSSSDCSGPKPKPQPRPNPDGCTADGTSECYSFQPKYACDHWKFKGWTYKEYPCEN